MVGKDRKTPSNESLEVSLQSAENRQGLFVRIFLFPEKHFLCEVSKKLVSIVSLEITSSLIKNLIGLTDGGLI